MTRFFDLYLDILLLLVFSLSLGERGGLKKTRHVGQDLAWGRPICISGVATGDRGLTDCLVRLDQVHCMQYQMRLGGLERDTTPTLLRCKVASPTELLRNQYICGLRIYRYLMVCFCTKPPQNSKGLKRSHEGPGYEQTAYWFVASAILGDMEKCTFTIIVGNLTWHRSTSQHAN